MEINPLVPSAHQSERRDRLVSLKSKLDWVKNRFIKLADFSKQFLRRVGTIGINGL